MPAIQRERIAAGLGIIVIGIVHALTPTKAAPENAFGYASGTLGLVLAAAAVYGLYKREEWGRQLLLVTGLAITVGFLLLHFLPYRNVLTDPYVGSSVKEPGIGFIQWAVVYAAVVNGLWAAFAAVRKGRDLTRAPSRPFRSGAATP